MSKSLNDMSDDMMTMTDYDNERKVHGSASSFEKKVNSLEDMIMI